MFRNALVTGGRSGIGAAIVTALENAGVEVEVLDLIDGFDVSDPRAWADVGPVDLACLNAGVVTGERDLAQVTDDQYRRILGANADGVVFGVRRLAQVMQPGSSIVVTASLAGLMEIEVDPVYGATKHFVVGLVRSAASQLRERGIRINAVCPGIVETPLLGAEAYENLRAAGFPLLESDDVARAVLLAAEDDEVGQAWVVQPGREPEKFRFPGVPGPRVEGAEGMTPPLRP